MSSFYAWLSRLRLIRRWGLMHAIQPENDAEHSLQAAMIAHGIAMIARDRYGRDISPEQAIDLTKQAFDFIASYDDEIPGVSAKECGNYRDHSLEGAKAEAARMVEVMKGVTVETLVYPE